MCVCVCLSLSLSFSLSRSLSLSLPLIFFLSLSVSVSILSLDLVFHSLLECTLSFLSLFFGTTQESLNEARISNPYSTPESWQKKVKTHIQVRKILAREETRKSNKTGKEGQGMGDATGQSGLEDAKTQRLWDKEKEQGKRKSGEGV